MTLRLEARQCYDLTRTLRAAAARVERPPAGAGALLRGGMSDAIDSVAALDSVAGTQPLPALLKSIEALDAHCEALLARSPFAVLTWCEPDGGQRVGCARRSAGLRAGRRAAGGRAARPRGAA